MAAPPRPRLAVVSPFLDKQQGTERSVIEWISHLQKEFEIHIYSQRVEDVDLSRVVWHRVSALKGPHILGFLWWFAANRVRRGFDRRFRGLHYDVVFTPGVNCSDADVISVHVLYSEYVRDVGDKLSFGRNPVRLWPRILHRKLYYGLICFLERRIYADPQKTLVVVSRNAGSRLQKISGRASFPVLYAGVDHKIFNPERRAELRRAARDAFSLAQDQFVLILVGNDWRNKGVPTLLEALEQLRDLPIRALIVSREDSSECRALVKEKELEERVQFLPPRKDIEFYYAAADAYVGPSLQDLYSLPPAEAMACGMPAIVSAAAGVSEIITDGVDGLILSDPRDARALAAIIRRLFEDEPLRVRLGEQAAQTTRQYTWQRNGEDLVAILEDVCREKARHTAARLEQT